MTGPDGSFYTGAAELPVANISGTLLLISGTAGNCWLLRKRCSSFVSSQKQSKLVDSLCSSDTNISADFIWPSDLFVQVNIGAMAMKYVSFAREQSLASLSL